MSLSSAAPASLLARRLAAAGGSAAIIHSACWQARQLGSGFSSSAAAAAADPAAAAAPGGPPDEQLRQAFSYCVNQVKTHDYENYLWVGQLAKALRPPLFALRAFNVETALIGDHAKSEMLVLMRCQWWKDAINDCYKGQPPQQPVVTALAAVLAQRPLTRYRLQQVVSTREEDLLSTQQPASLAALEKYADGTAGQLLHLQLEAAGLAGGDSGASSSGGSGGSGGGSVSAEQAAAAEHAAMHLGRAAGIVALLRGTYAHGARNRVYLPADLCAQHDVSPSDVLAGRDSEGLRDVTLAVASAAKQHLDEARRLAPELAPPARPLFLPAVATGLYLDALERCGFNLFDQRMLRGAVSPLTYQLQLKWALLRNKY